MMISCEQEIGPAAGGILTSGSVRGRHRSRRTPFPPRTWGSLSSSRTVAIDMPLRQPSPGRSITGFASPRPRISPDQVSPELDTSPLSAYCNGINPVLFHLVFQKFSGRPILILAAQADTAMTHTSPVFSRFCREHSSHTDFIDVQTFRRRALSAWSTKE